MININSLCSCCKEQDIKNVFWGALLVLLLLSIVWVGVDALNKVRLGSQIEANNIITVSGTGDVYAKPDLAQITFSVVTEAKTVAQALTENTQKMNATIDFIKSSGVEEKDLKTTNFNIYPQYQWYDPDKCPLAYYPCPSGKRVLVGYEVSQSLQVKIRALDKVGDIIQGAAEKGANQAGDLQFTIDNQDELKNQAREEAIDEAKTKAKELAKQLGIRLGKMTNFSEAAAYPYYYALDKAAAPAGMGGGESSARIETGENKIEVTVSITYEIR